MPDKKREAGPVIRINLETGEQEPVPTSARRAGLRARGAATDAAAAGKASATRAVTTAFPALQPIVAAASPAGRTALADFFGGLSGQSAAPKKAATAPTSRVAAVNNALGQGAKARQTPEAAPYTPYERQLAAIDTILSAPHSLEDLATVSTLLPQRQAPDAKDLVLGRASALSQEVFQSQVGAIYAQLEAQEIDQNSARQLIQKATDAHFARQAGLAGFNPANLEEARLLRESSQQE